MKTQKNSQGPLSRKSNNYWKWMAGKIRDTSVLAASLVFALAFAAPAPAHATIYATADNGTTNLFGTLDLTTGQFSQIATTTPLFFALTTGPNNQIIGADQNGGSSGHLYTVSPSGVTAQYGSVSAPDVFTGLAFSGSAGKFFADNINSEAVTLYSIAKDGNSSSSIGVIFSGHNTGTFPTGDLAYGPSGALYTDFDPAANDGGINSALYTVNTSNGKATQVGSGLGTDVLTLVSVGNTLYGIDAIATSNIGIYTINTTTGVATQVSTVTGLPNTDDFFLDTATGVPDTGSSLGLLSLALTALIGASRLHSLRPS